MKPINTVGKRGTVARMAEHIRESSLFGLRVAFEIAHSVESNEDCPEGSPDALLDRLVHGGDHRAKAFAAVHDILAVLADAEHPEDWVIIDRALRRIASLRGRDYAFESEGYRWRIK